MDEIHIANDTNCDKPSSEIFRILLPDRRYIKVGLQEVRLEEGGAWTGLIWLRIRTSGGSGVPRNFVPGGVQQIQLRIED